MNRSGIILPAGILTLGILWFFSRFFLSGAVIYAGDNFNLLVPAMTFFVKQMRGGVFPLWNPFILSGMPFFADIAYSLLHPANIVYFLLPPFTALTIQVLIDYAVGFSGMYCLGRRLGMTQYPAVFSALAWTFSGTLVISSNNISTLHTAVLIPFVLWSWIGYLKHGGRKHVLSAVGLTSLQIIAGHPQLTYYTLLLCIAYAGMLRGIPVACRLGRAGIIIVFAAGLTAVQTLPFLELAGFSTRMQLGDPYRSFGSFRPVLLIRYILPRLMGVRPWGTAFIDDGNIFGYIGMLPLFYSFSVRKISRDRWFFILAGLTALLSSFGPVSPVFRILTLIPGAGLLRIPSQLLFITTVSLSLLAGYGLEDGLNRKKTGTGIIPMIIPGLFIFTGIVLMTGYHGLAESAGRLLGHPGMPFLVTKLQLPVLTRLEWLIRNAGLNVLIIGVSVLVFVRRQRPAVILLVTMADLAILAAPSLHMMPETAVTSWIGSGRETISKCPGFDPEQHRLIALPAAHASPDQRRFGNADVYKEEAWQGKIMRQNVNMYADIGSADGYSSVVYRPYQDFILSGRYEPTGLALPDRPDRILGEVGVSCLIGKGGSVRMNPYARPVLSLEYAGGASITGLTVTRRDADSLAVSAEATASAAVIFRDTDYPGWQATVDGKPAAISPYAGIFKSVRIPAGRHTVIFSYLPDSVIAGLTVSVVTGVAFILFLLSAVR